MKYIMKYMAIPDIVDSNLPRTHIVIYEDLIDMIVRQDNESGISSNLRRLCEANGKYYIFYSLIRYTEFWQNIIAEENVALDYLLLHMKGIKFDIPSKIREKMLQTAVETIEQGLDNLFDHYIDYVDEIIVPLLSNSCCDRIETSPEFYLDIMERLLQISPPSDKEAEIVYLKRRLIALILQDLDSLGYYNLDLERYLGIMPGRKALCAVLRNNSKFFPLLAQYLQKVKQENFDDFVDLYLLIIDDILFDDVDWRRGERRPDYETITEMMLDLVYNAPPESRIQTSIQNFIRYLANYNSRAIKKVILPALQKRPNQFLLDCLAGALVHNKFSLFEQLMETIVTTPGLRAISNNMIHNILFYIDKVKYDIASWAAALALRMIRYKDFFKENIFSQTYLLQTSASYKLAVLLYFVYVIDGCHAWQKFIEEHVDTGAEPPATILTESSLECLFVSLLAYNFRLNCNLEQTMQRTADNIKDAYDCLLALGCDKKAVRNALYIATANIRRYPSIDSIVGYFDDHLVADFKAEMGRFGFFKHKNPQR